MDKKTVLLLGLIIGLILVGIGSIIIFGSPSNKTLSTPLANLPQEIIPTVPSETFIVYTDPTGFTFSYPDNLSLVKNEVVDTSTYADIQLTAKGVNGNLTLKISDSKLKSIAEWVKVNNPTSQQPPKEVTLGNLKALEVTTNDRLMTAALDQGVLFTVEIPLIEQDFWIKVYNHLLTDFSFAAQASEGIPTSVKGDFPAESVTFEGEEIVE